MQNEQQGFQITAEELVVWLGEKELQIKLRDQNIKKLQDEIQKLQDELSKK